MIGSTKNVRENYPRKCFWTQEKETKVKFNAGLSANRPSINWALVYYLRQWPGSVSCWITLLACFEDINFNPCSFLHNPVTASRSCRAPRQGPLTVPCCNSAQYRPSPTVSFKITNPWSSVSILGEPTIYTNRLGGDLVHRHNYRIWRRGRTTCYKIYPNMLNILKRVVKLRLIKGVWRGIEGKGSFRWERKARAGTLSSRAPRVSLAPKTSFPFPFKRLPRRLYFLQLPKRMNGAKRLIF